MSMIDDISNVVLILIRVGTVFRVGYCLLRLVTAEEEAIHIKSVYATPLYFTYWRNRRLY